MLCKHYWTREKVIINGKTQVDVRVDALTAEPERQRQEDQDFHTSLRYSRLEKEKKVFIEK